MTFLIDTFFYQVKYHEGRFDEYILIRIRILFYFRMVIHTNRHDNVIV